MSELNKKLESLRTQFGLVSGRDVAPKPKDAPPDQPKSAPPSEEKNGRVLSDALAAQLRARFLLHAPAPEQPHSGGNEAMEIDALLPGSIVGEEHCSFFLLRKRYPLDTAIGDVPLGDALESCGKEIALSACDDTLLTFDPRKTCFMDTETTGLAGGAGTVPFLVGMGFFQADEFVLEQCFMRDYDDEEAMLEYLAEKLAAFSVVVSYNGKSFDLPLMRSRFVQHRMKFPLDAVSHYDLVHAARRVWKKRLNNCALNNIEKEVLGLQRHGDVPGYLIPHLWMEYLETRDARPLEPVFYHHEMDILSLAALTGYLSKRLAADNDISFHHAEDRLAVVKLYVKNKDYESAAREARQFLEISRVKDDLRRECLALLAQSCKRIGLFEEMEQVWATMHDEFPEDAQAASELAKYKEHQAGNIQDAITICRETLDIIQKKMIPLDFEISALRGRLARLEKKQDKLHKKFPPDSEIFSS